MSLLVLSSLMLLLVRTDAQGGDVARPTFHPPLVGDTVPSVCENFTVGKWQQQEFYSPGFPRNYPNKTECIHLLIAPKGYRIRLDFRDDFEIEQSPDCKYDYLEFRDGPFGYSPRIGRYCGSHHPPMRESTSRFMWAHFVSDDSIEYKGFRVVYDFFKPESTAINDSDTPTVCRIVMDYSEHNGYLTEDDIPKDMVEKINATKQPADCTWAFYLPINYRISLKFDHLQTLGGDCEKSFMEIYEGSTALTNRNKRICTNPPASFKTESNHVYIRVFGSSYELLPQFTAFFTLFQNLIVGSCPDDMFDCGDQTCINKSLVCNGNINCGMKWDEANCEISTTAPPTREPFVIQYHTVIIGIVGGAILTIIFLAIVITCYQKRKEETHQRNALRCEERHAIEVEMTNLLNRSPQHGHGMNAVASHSQHGEPNGPVNHTGAAVAAVGNHVSSARPHLIAHSQAIHGTSNGHGLAHAPEQKPYAPQKTSPPMDNPDYAGHSGGSGSYPSRYLDVHGRPYTSKEEPAPNPSSHNQIQNLPVHEHRTTSRKHSSDRKDKSRSPSPRPDVIQEERFYSDQKNKNLQQTPLSSLTSSIAPRRMSNETVLSDKSDVWKPLPSKDVGNVGAYQKSQPSAGPSSAPGLRQHSIWTANPEDQQENWRREGIGFEPIADPSLYTMPKQTHLPVESSKSLPKKHKGNPPTPPQRRTPALHHQTSAPVPPIDTDSPPPQRPVYSRTPPAKPKMSQSRSSPGITPKSRQQQEKNPTMFYTRPNQGRSERNLPKQHHPV